MRLIDADALKEIISGNSYILRDFINSMNFGMFWDGIEQAIDESPTIDAVPVVNCINCTQMEIQSETTNCHTKSCCFCKKWKSLVSPVGFCNFGERKDDEID